MAITRQESAAWDQHLHGQFDTVMVRLGFEIQLFSDREGRFESVPYKRLEYL